MGNRTLADSADLRHADHFRVVNLRQGVEQAGLQRRQALNCEAHASVSICRCYPTSQIPKSIGLS